MPFLLIVKLTVLSLCAVLKLIGELWWHDAQRFILPVVLGLGVSIITGVWWLGLCVLPVIAPIDLGYKDYGPSNGFDRGAWLFFICLVAGLACAVFHHLSWWFYVPWCIVSGVWGGVTRSWWNVIIAPVSGALIGLLAFLVH
jgi:hypothetical protein